MNEQQQDKLRELYRRSRNEQPSIEMDQSIRIAALRALNRGRRKWLWGLSSAAVVLLCFSIVMQLVVDQPAQFELESEDMSISEYPASPSLKPRSANESQLIDQKIAGAGPVAESMPSLAADSSLEEIRSLAKREAALLLENKTEDEQHALSEDASFDILRSRQAIAIPKLPTDLAGLKAMRAGLSGEERAGKISLYAHDKLILVASPETGGFAFRAWPGAQVLGVKVDWDVLPAQWMDCEQENVYLRCVLEQGVDGYFEGQRLDHISWQQPHG